MTHRDVISPAPNADVLPVVGGIARADAVLVLTHANYRNLEDIRRLQLNYFHFFKKSEKVDNLSDVET